MCFKNILLFILFSFLLIDIQAQYVVSANSYNNTKIVYYTGEHNNDIANDYSKYTKSSKQTHGEFIKIQAKGNDGNPLRDISPETCSNWMQINTNDGGLQIGDLDVTGTTITVEATFNRTQPRSQLNELYAGDLVSKHRGPEDVNYLLRANTAEITTDEGYFRTPDICDIELNKTYHVALTYDGTTLKFYRNGFLMSAVPASGKLFQNDFITTIGNFAPQPGFDREGLLGYINEVRIWNTVRTQSEINTYLDKSLPNPSSQLGLLAYYTFDNVKNKQGNSKWDGKLINGATINQINPTCSSYSKDSCEKVVVPPAVVIPAFTIPDTVCVNTPVHITNTTTGASNYYWSFCTADLKNTVPGAVNMGNVGNALSQPVFMDLVLDNGKYYAFVTNHYPGGLVRLDFGNSYLNTPVATSFGNLGVLPSGYGTEGIQVVKNDGKWYAIIVTGSPPNNVPSKLVKLEFGTSIENSSPVATDWGNIGDMSLPIDFYMFKNMDQWYGFTVNAFDNTITRFAFTSSFDNVPTGTNLGNVGSLLDYPTGVHAIDNGGNWSLFVTNAYSNKLVRLDFGTSLLNTPVAKDLGSFNNTLNSPRDITIINSCESAIGYIVNGVGNDIVQFDFNNDLNSIPVGKSLGNIGGLYFPHSISKLFRIDNDLYSFITNVNNNTITRLKFAGCTNSNIGGSSIQNPPDIQYNKAGTYNITLSVDEGLPTQSSTCRQVVVMAPPTPHPTVDTAFCEGGNINLESFSTGNNYIWNTGATTSKINVSGTGKYWVTTDVYGCTSTDSFRVSNLVSPVVELGKDTALCKGDSLIVFAKSTGSTFLWQDGSVADSMKITTSGSYTVAVTNMQGCTVKDTIQINALLPPVLSGVQDRVMCSGDLVQLSVTASGNNNAFIWQPDTTLSASNIANPVAAPHDTTMYHVAVKSEDGCIAKDSVRVNVVARPIVNIRPDTTVCSGSAVTLTTSAANATIFSWSPAQSLSNSATLSPVATPITTTTYAISASNGVCNVTDAVTINIMQLPIVRASNDTTVCGSATTQLFAAGANTYTWFPATGLNNTAISNPIASPLQTIMYHVKGSGDNGCVNEDSVQITVAALPQFSISPVKSEVCFGDSVLVTAAGGEIYTWEASPDILQPNSAATYIKPLANGVYKVVVINNTCKITDTLYIRLFIAAKPTIHVSRSNDVDCATNTATLTATGGSSYNWTPASTLTNANSPSPLAMPNETTTYHVKATGANGCVAEDSVKVEVKIANAENAYQMATAFTPNGDGINDCFGVKRWSVVNNLDFSVYNRWGVLLFHSNKVSACWDGTYKGLLQDAGAYIYVIKAKTFCGNINKKGTVVLIR